MRKMADGGNVTVPCLIYTGMTMSRKPRCILSWISPKGASSVPRHKSPAGVRHGCGGSGNQRLVEAAALFGYWIKKSGDAYEILSTRAIINAYRLLGAQLFPPAGTLRQHLARRIHFPPCFDALRHGAVSETYETELNDRIFIKRLSAVDPEEIIRRGKMTSPPIKPPCALPASFWKSTTASSGADTNCLPL